MRITDNKTQVPLSHYKALYHELDPKDVTDRTGTSLTDDGSCFNINILGHSLQVKRPDFELIPVSDDFPKTFTDPGFCILIMRFLIRGQRTAWQGRFLSYRELPWGDVYDSNFNGRCRLRLAYGFGQDLESFIRSASRLGGTVFAQKPGSVTVDLPLSGGITVRMILHEGDEEFPPAAQILFSDNVSSAWDAEDLAGMGEVIISALKELRYE